MDKNKISQFIDQPNLISDSDLADLKLYLDKYPFCSSLHILYLKGLANTNDLHFEDVLKSSAIHINSRERLYEVIHLESEAEEQIDEKDAKTSDETIEIVDPILTEAQLEPNEIKLISPTLVRKEEISENDIKGKGFKEEPIESELEKNILLSAVEDALIFDVKNIVKPDDEIDIEKGEKLIEDGIELNFNSDETDLNENKIEEIIDVKPSIDISKMSFTEWLKFKKNNQTISTEPITKPVQEKESKLTKKEINNLLDSFITNEPKMSRPKKEFYNPVKNAKESLDENDILVSETLAKIYYLQKKYSKAIKAYEQLSLLNPKKKSFFANRIEKIKKEELK